LGRVEFALGVEIDADPNRTIPRRLRLNFDDIPALAHDPFADEPTDGEGGIVAGGAQGRGDAGALAIRERAGADIDGQRFFPGQLNELLGRHSGDKLRDSVI